MSAAFTVSCATCENMGEHGAGRRSMVSGSWPWATPEHPMRGKSRTGLTVRGVWHRLDGWWPVEGWWVGGCCGRCRCPSPRLYLASNRVCPNILHASL
jgi:hypothetical protein